MAQFHKLAQQYPDVAKQIKYVGTYRGPNRPIRRPRFSGEFAHHSPYNNYIGLNPKWYNNPTLFQEQLTSATQSYRGLAPSHPPGCDTIESVITHEFGHAVDNWIRKSKVSMTPYVRPSGEGLASNLLQEWYSVFGDTSVYSRYGRRNRMESIAETFAAMIHGTPEVQQLPNVRSLRKVMNGILRGQLYYPDEYIWTTDIPIGPERARAVARIAEIFGNLLNDVLATR